jgi:two-component system, cell cycle sensor histidine kinase and response regulator CckA
MAILLVEDDIQVQFLIWKLLKADGFTVLTASSGEAGLKVARNHSGPIRLLLTDMGLPGISGLELYQKIVLERPGIKAVVMSGDLTAREQSESAGLPFLQKPFQALAVREKIRTALGSIN